MLPRFRSARVAGLTLLLAAPLVAANAAPAFGVGDSAVVSAVVTEGNVHVESTKGLSRVTVVLCGGSTVVSDNWTGGQMSGDVEVDGVGAIASYDEHACDQPEEEEEETPPGGGNNGGGGDNDTGGENKRW